MFGTSWYESNDGMASWSISGLVTIRQGKLYTQANTTKELKIVLKELRLRRKELNTRKRGLTKPSTIPGNKGSSGFLKSMKKGKTKTTKTLRGLAWMATYEMPTPSIRHDPDKDIRSRIEKELMELQIFEIEVERKLMILDL